MPSNFESSNLPINYISKSKVSYNQREAEAQRQQLQKQPDKEFINTKNTLIKFNGQNTLFNAKNAYESNSKIFSLFRIPHVSLDQTPKIDKDLPRKAQEVKEINLRHEMVNTYIENDRYFQITA